MLLQLLLFTLTKLVAEQGDRKVKFVILKPRFKAMAYPQILSVGSKLIPIYSHTLAQNA
jgi:hypothetical protein